ncbi:CC/Se motif family (seleno)protein [uncultured Propionivibrio sp.]|uniref:CC/Se motif family (seleno)protein n=1 Tax=uncultured Propionivibrio sp. TaxID=426737 RepID=UPI0029C08FB9|nr:CC/Se motif family (seleno)protein [uncultured Propionivibrio sp.]
MISLSEDAIAYANEKRSPIHIGLPYKVSGCCFDLTESPSVVLGEPSSPGDYQRQTINGVTVFVPREFPEHDPIVIKTRSLLGFRQLVIDGWKLV